MWLEGFGGRREELRSDGEDEPHRFGPAAIQFPDVSAIEKVKISGTLVGIHLAAEFGIVEAVLREKLQALQKFEKLGTEGIGRGLSFHDDMEQFTVGLAGDGDPRQLSEESGELR